MNLKLIALPATLAGLTLVAFTGCNKQNDLSKNTDPSYEPARVTDIPSADTPIVTSSSPGIMTPSSNVAWDDLKKSAYDKQGDFSRDLKAMSSEYDAKISELRADYNEAQASASRKAAMEELKNSQADFNQKMSAVGTASADTWDSVRADAAAAWDRLEASYNRARAEK